MVKKILTLMLLISTNFGFAAQLQEETEQLKGKLQELEQRAIEDENTQVIEEIQNMKYRIEQLEDNISGPGIPTPLINHYVKSTNCTALTTQPTDVCTNGSYCYNTDSFVDQNSVSLNGYTIKANKTTADYDHSDGKVYLCSTNNLTASAAVSCTPIGGNSYGGSNSVEFTIPANASNARVYAISTTALLNAPTSSALTNISVCKRVSPSVLINP